MTRIHMRHIHITREDVRTAAFVKRQMHSMDNLQSIDIVTPWRVHTPLTHDYLHCLAHVSPTPTLPPLHRYPRLRQALL